jgi:membrane-bound ClpP family serine protease
MTKGISYTVGIILALMGLVGFFNDPILGVFEVDLIHNLILIVLGVILIGAAWQNQAGMGVKIVGIAALIIAVLGYIPPSNRVLSFIETNLATSALHTIVALILLYAGFMAKEERRESASSPASEPPVESGAHHAGTTD